MRQSLMDRITGASSTPCSDDIDSKTHFRAMTSHPCCIFEQTCPGTGQDFRVAKKGKAGRKNCQSLRVPPTINEDRDSSSIASDEHKMEKRPRVGNSEFRPGLSASDFDHAVAERASRDTTCVALAIASTSLATIQEHEVQPGTIPEPGLLQVGLFSNHNSRRPFGSRIRCRVHNCILLERGSEKKALIFRQDTPGSANLRPPRWFSLVRPIVIKAALAPRWSRYDRRVRTDGEFPWPRWR